MCLVFIVAAPLARAQSLKKRNWHDTAPLSVIVQQMEDGGLPAYAAVMRRIREKRLSHNEDNWLTERAIRNTEIINVLSERRKWLNVLGVMRHVGYLSKADVHRVDQLRIDIIKNITKLQMADAIPVGNDIIIKTKTEQLTDALDTHRERYFGTEIRSMYLDGEDITDRLPDAQRFRANGLDIRLENDEYAIEPGSHHLRIEFNISPSLHLMRPRVQPIREMTMEKSFQILERGQLPDIAVDHADVGRHLGKILKVGVGHPPQFKDIPPDARLRVIVQNKAAMPLSFIGEFYLNAGGTDCRVATLTFREGMAEIFPPFNEMFLMDSRVPIFPECSDILEKGEDGISEAKLILRSNLIQSLSQFEGRFWAGEIHWGHVKFQTIDDRLVFVEQQELEGDFTRLYDCATRH
jgi:hypothetical protein